MTAPFWPLYCDFREGIDPRVVPTRVGSGTVFTTQGRWREVPGNTLRRTAPDGALLMEAGGTNQNANPRLDGATVGIVGSGGAYPTGVASVVAGLTTEILSVSNVGDARVMRARTFGTAVSPTWTFDLTTASAAPAAAQAEPWYGSFLFALPAAPAGPVSFSSRFTARAASNVIVTGGASVQVFSPGAPLATVPHFWTTPADPAVTKVTWGFIATVVAGQNYDWTWEFALPHQVRNSTVATNPILPPIGAPAASTIGADSAAMLLRDFAIAPADAGLFLIHFRAVAGATTAQLIATLTDGTTPNRVQVFRLADGRLQAQAVVGGAVTGTVNSVATVANGATGVAAIRFGAGDLALSVNGTVPVRAQPSASPTAITTLNLWGHGGSTALVAFRPEREPQRPLNAISQTLARQGPGAGGMS
jgi:hypothetical protein